MMEFQNLIASCPAEVGQTEQEAEARFSFLQGGYVEDYDLRGIFFFWGILFYFIVNNILVSDVYSLCS